jgi:hypothetical protein
MICKNCEYGLVVLGERHVTHEMAIDAGIPDAEGTFYELETETCTCCNGDFENCLRCEDEG